MARSEKYYGGYEQQNNLQNKIGQPKIPPKKCIQKFMDKYGMEKAMIDVMVM